MIVYGRVAGANGAGNGCASTAIRSSQKDNQPPEKDKMIGKYIYRFLKLWLFWFWAPILDMLAFFADPYIPGFSFPREVYLVIPLFGFIAANIKLFAEQQKRIDELEGWRANIRFKKHKDFIYIPSSQTRCPFPDLKVERNSRSRLDKDGLPAWIVIAAHLQGQNKSEERGDLVWEIDEVDLPPLFVLEGKGGFQSGQGGGMPLTKVDGWRDSFEARYDLPLKIAQRHDARFFARELNSLGFYRIVIHYWTKRGIDDYYDAGYKITLEGNFEELRKDLCEKWTNFGFDELAQLTGC